MEKYYWFSLFVSVNAIFLLSLAVYISVLRIKNRIAYGEGDNKQLARAIRVHRNGIEQVPIFSLLLLILSFYHMQSSCLAALAITFTGLRLTHAYGILYRVHVARQIGAGVTYILLGVAAVSVLVSISA